MFLTVSDYYMPHIVVDLLGSAKRIANCFFKGFVRCESQTLVRTQSALQQRKIQKLARSTH